MENIRDIIKKLGKGDDEEDYSVPGKVSKVTGIKTVNVKPLDGGPEIFNVKLSGEETEAGVILVPKVGSVVVVSFLSKNTGFISLFSEVDKVYLRGNAFGGLIKIEELVKKVNALEDKVNEILTAYNSHTHPYINVAVPAVTTPTASLVATPLVRTLKAEIENTKVSHG